MKFVNRIVCNGVDCAESQIVGGHVILPMQWHVFRNKNVDYRVCSLKCGKSLDELLKAGKPLPPPTTFMQLIECDGCLKTFPADTSGDFHMVFINHKEKYVHSFECAEALAAKENAS